MIYFEMYPKIINLMTVIEVQTTVKQSTSPNTMLYIFTDSCNVSDEGQKSKEKKMNKLH